MVEKYQIEKDPEDEFFHDYDIRSKIGSLMFASVCTRPDITFAVSYLARFTNHPSRQALLSGKKTELGHLSTVTRTTLAIRPTTNLRLEY